MRKVDPTDVCDDFDTEIVELTRFFTAASAVIQSDKDLSLLSELVFHRGYVAVEAFLSAWFAGSINRDSSAFLTSRTTQINEAIKKLFSDWDASHTKYTPPVHISVDVLGGLLDPKGRNLTFSTMKEMKKRAQIWLVSGQSAKVRAIGGPRGAIIDAAKTIRNCIAHQSESSFREMNRRLSSLPNTGVAAQLRRSVNAVNVVGAYLKAAPSGRQRVLLYLDEFRGLGRDLR